MKLLTEYFHLPYDSKNILEAKEKNGKISLFGVFQEADVKNQNGRIYPRKILEREVDNYQQAIRERRAIGELDHPEVSVVELKNASHLVTELGWDGNKVMGKLEVLNTPNGNILKGLLSDGIRVGISSRGVGSTSKNEGMDVEIVSEDFSLICLDIVSEPSVKSALLNLSEAKNIDFDPRKFYSKTERIYRILNGILKK